MELSDKVANLYHNTFNAKFAIISAACNGPIAAVINSSYEIDEMLWAGGTQAVSSFLSTGITARMVHIFNNFSNELYWS